MRSKSASENIIPLIDAMMTKEEADEMDQAVRISNKAGNKSARWWSAFHNCEFDNVYVTPAIVAVMTGQMPYIMEVDFNEVFHKLVSTIPFKRGDILTPVFNDEKEPVIFDLTFSAWPEFGPKIKGSVIRVIRCDSMLDYYADIEVYRTADDPAFAVPKYRERIIEVWKTKFAPFEL